MHTKNRGFALVDLMIAVMVIGLLAAVAYPMYGSLVTRAQEAQVKCNMHRLQLAAEDFASQAMGLYPENPTNSVALALAALGIVSSNQRRLADCIPADGYTVSVTGNALLPGEGRFCNPFLRTGFCLDYLALSSNPVPPPHAIIYQGSSGQGTVFWAPATDEGQYWGAVRRYLIFGDGKLSIIPSMLQSAQ